ncbi:Lsg locus protein 4, partial [Pasteurellaceae bacterium 15-036681]
VKQFLKQLENNQLAYWLADDFILFGNEFKLDIKVIRPLMVIENPQLNSNLESIRGSISHSLWQKLLKYPLKKALAVKRNFS